MSAAVKLPVIAVISSETDFESDLAYVASQEFIDDLRKEREFFEKREKEMIRHSLGADLECIPRSVKHLIVNQEMEGSSPSAGTTKELDEVML